MQNRLEIYLKINSKNDTILDGFSVALGSVLEAKLVLKIHQKIDHKQTCKLGRFLNDFLGRGSHASDAVKGEVSL